MTRVSSLEAKPRTIGDSLNQAKGYTQGFDFMRIALAIAVLVYHSVLSSYGHDADAAIWTGWWRAIPSPILPAFFALSGFLVAGSLFRVRSLPQFLSLRVLRVVPALFVQVFLSAIVLGPIVTTFPLADYFAGRYFWSYWANTFGWIH